MLALPRAGVPDAATAAALDGRWEWIGGQREGEFLTAAPPVSLALRRGSSVAVASAIVAGSAPPG